LDLKLFMAELLRELCHILTEFEYSFTAGENQISNKTLTALPPMP